MVLFVLLVLSLSIVQGRAEAGVRNLTALSHDVIDLWDKLLFVVKPFVKEDSKCVKDVLTQLSVTRTATQICDPDWPISPQLCAYQLPALVNMLYSSIEFFMKSCKIGRPG